MFRSFRISAGMAVEGLLDLLEMMESPGNLHSPEKFTRYLSPSGLKKRYFLFIEPHKTATTFVRHIFEAPLWFR
jgi:hypothetical protein